MATVQITVARERLLAFVEQFEDLCSKKASFSTEDFLEHQKWIFSENLDVDIRIEEQLREKKSNISLVSALKDISSKDNDSSTNSEDEEEDSEMEIEEDAIEPDGDTSSVAAEIPETETSIIDMFSKNVSPEKERVNDTEADMEGFKNVPSGKNTESTQAVNIREDETLDERPDVEENKVVNKVPDEKHCNKIMDIPDGKKKSEITRCSECNFQAAGFNGLKVHIEMHHLNLRYKCTFCPRDSKEIYLMKVHLKKYHKETEGNIFQLDYECKRCDIREPMEAFNDHMLLYHPDLKIFYEGRRTKAFGQKQDLDCRFCPFKAKIASQLNLHVETSHMNLDYRCKLCNFTCNSYLNIRGHVGSTHAPKSLIEYEDRRKAPKKEMRIFLRLNIYRHCAPCETEIKHQENLTKHIQSNHPEVKYRPECQRRNKRKREGYSKDSSKSTGSGSGDFNCVECEYSTALKYNLTSHTMLRHLNSKFECMGCNVKEKQISRMLRHVKDNHQNNSELMKSTCFKCSFTTENLEVFTTHINDVHLSYLPATSRKRKTHCRGRRVKKEKESGPGDFDCVECEYSTALKNNLTSHTMLRHMKSVLECMECNLKRKCMRLMLRHVKDNHENNSTLLKSTCFKCSFTTDSLEVFKKHTAEIHLPYLPPTTSRKTRRKGQNPGDFNCVECEYSSDFRSNLTSHTMLKHMNSKFECMECKLREKRMCKMLRHVKDNHQNNSAHIKSTCVKCSFTTEILEEFKTHTNEVHLSYLPTTSGIGRRGHIVKRNLIHDQKPTFNCLACSTESTDKSQIIAHIFENHDVNEDLDEDEQLEDIVKYLQVLCKKCDFSGTFAEYNVHLTSRPEITPVVNMRCNICQSDEKDLSTHKLLVHGKCYYACKSCDFKSHQHRSLLVHSKANHTSCGFQFLCGFCNVKLGKSGMEDHFLEHHQEKFSEKPTKTLQKCNECDFQNISDLKLRDHKRKVHSVYNCSECEAVFNVQKRYLIHKRHKHNNYTFDCDKCDFKTRHESSIRRHANSVHKTINFYPCPDCGRQFTRNDNMRFHRKSCMGA